MSALFVAGAFAVSGNVAKADAVQANNSNNVNSTEVKQNNTNASANQVATKIPSKEELKDIAMKQYHAAIGHMGEEEYQTAVTDPDATGTGIHSADGKWLAHVDTTDLNWSKMNSKLNNAKNEVDAYLNDAVQNKSTLANTRKNATDSLKKVPLPTTGNILDNLDRQEKDKNWVLANTDPNTIEFGKFTFSPDNKDEHGRGEGETDSDSTNNTENKTVIPWFVYNKELIKVDKDAYNRVHGIKSNENSSDTGKDQTTTDTNKNSNSQVSTKSNSSKTNESTDIKKNDSTTVTVPTDKKTSNSKSETSTTATQSGVEVKNVQTGDSVKNSANPQVVVNSLTSNKSVAQSGNVATKSNAVQTVALSNKVNTNKATANHASTVNNGKVATSNEKRLPQAGTDEKISLFASLAGLSIASLGLGALGVDRKRKNN